MPEPVWYYARGEVERGPFTSVQIKALANAGKLRREDLVWKEGMENWTAAEEIPELFPAEPPASDGKSLSSAATTEAPAVSRGFPAPLSAGPSRDVGRLISTAGWGCLIVGLLSLVLARGCESLGERKVSRLDAAARLEADEVWQRQRSPVASELETLQKKGRFTPAEQERLRELTQTLNQLDASRTAEELAASQRLGVNRAMSDYRAGAFLRGIALHGGVVFLAVGGLALAILGTGSDHWLGVGVVLVVCYAVVRG